jgi:hypothetical protein
LYQRIGNFFIGVAPVLVISVLLYVISYYLLPSFAVKVNEIVGSTSSLSEAARAVWAATCVFFSFVGCWQWWVFVAIGLFLAPHMTLSGADIKGALSGLVFVLLLFFLADVILYFCARTLLSEWTSITTKISGYLFCFLTLALFISLFAVGVSWIYRLLKKS